MAAKLALSSCRAQPLHSFRLLCVLSLCRGSGASLVRIRSASSRWRVSCTDGTTHEGSGRFAGRLAARDDSLCTLSFDFRAKDGLDVAPAAVVSSAQAGGEALAAPMQGGDELTAELSRPRRRTALNSSAVNQTDSSRGCSDFPLPFVENPSPATLLGDNCSTTIALSSHLFPAFASGIPSVCRASYEVWVQQTGRLVFSTSPPPLAYGVTDPSAPMAELCAATCASAGVQSSHCAVPSPPPPAPPIPPPAGGTGNSSEPIVATTIEQLHQALSIGYSHGHVHIRVPVGSVLHLDGRELLVDGINVTIRSDGGEAVLDAQGRSRLFEVLSGGSLHLESLRLLNGWADISGGALIVRGAAATLVRCSLLNSSAAAAGGVAIVLDGELLLLGCLVQTSSSTYGGAFYVNGASAVFLQHSVISVSSAVQGGGVIYSIGDSSTTFVMTCDISESKAMRGGVISALLGSSVSISRMCKISHSSASLLGGCVYALSGFVSLFDGCLISMSSATENGGMLGCFLSVFIMNNCTIEKSTVASGPEEGGAVWLQVSSYCAISNYSTIAHSASLGEASEGGAIYVATSTLEMSLGSRILHSIANDGGAIFMTSGNLRMVDGCMIKNSSSTRNGGAMHITSGNVIISGGSTILDSIAEHSGGAFYISSSVMLLSDGVMVANSFSSWGGGAIFATDSTVSISDGCVIVTSNAAVGGALHLLNTNLLMANGSTIANSTAVTRGGALALLGGSFVMTGGSTLSFSTSANEGGAISIGGTNSMCNLTDAVIEASTSSGRGSAFNFVDASYPLLILTFVEIKQFACQDSLFFVSQSTIGDAVILRNVTISQPKCTAPVEQSPATSLRCNDTFVSRDQERGVCASSNEDACYEEALPVVGLNSVMCRCPWPEYPDPAYDERLAPYLESGCIKPMQLTGITVVSEKVSIALQKPENVEGSLNLTLQIEGTDNARPAVWRLLNTSNLLSRSPWLRLPSLSGTVYPQSISSGVTFAIVPLTFTASGLLERAALYEERLTVDVRSEIASAARTLTVDVSLSVQARTSFVVWGSVARESGVQHICKVQQLLNLTFLVSTPQRRYFTACDVDSLPVDHLLPLQRDPRRFRALMSTSEGNGSELSVSYVGAGVYDISFAIPTWGAASISLLLGRQIVESLAGNATCPLDRVSLLDGRCGCSVGFFRTSDSVGCAPCEQGKTSLPGAQSSEDCALCANGFYRPSDHSLSSECVPCLAGGKCTANATLQSILVLDGFWRLSEFSTELLPCPTELDAICVGGSRTGVCAQAFTGPLCKACSRSDQHFEDGECLDCPDVTVRLIMAGGVAAALLVLFILAQHWNVQCSRGGQKKARLSLKMSHVLLGAVPSGIQLRILLSFYQCVTAVGDVYLIDFDPPYADFLHVFDWVRVDWLSILMPTPCFGSLEQRMLLVALAPIAGMASCALIQLFLTKASGLPLLRGVLASTSLCLFVVFLLSPQISYAIFEAFQCVPFEWSPTVTHYFLRSSLSVQCYTADHDRILLVSYVLMVVWPIGSVVLFFSLVHRARSRLTEHIRDSYVISIRLLHSDYKPEYCACSHLAVVLRKPSFHMIRMAYDRRWPACAISTAASLFVDFWASVELLQRSILLGWVLLIDAEKSFVRLIIGSIVCLIVLVWTSISLPYVRMHDNALAIAAALLLQLTYIWSSFVKVLNVVDQHAAQDDEQSIWPYVLFGLESSNALPLALFFFGGSLLGIFLILWTSRLQAQRWGHHLWLKDSGRTPELSLRTGKRWMLFISHVWRTGQDQAAFIKRQLQRMMPSMPIFLDVDDLVSIDELEEYVDASGCALLFLSKGYLISHNCLREARRAARRCLPLCFVWEADYAKGGAPLRYLCDHECPKDLVEVIFGDDGKIIQWHRPIEFQLLSLKKVAEVALLASPAYSHKSSLPLSVHGEVALGVQNPAAVCIYVSPSNVGCTAFAQELRRAHFAKLVVAEELPSEADWRRGHNARFFRKSIGTSTTMPHFLLYLSHQTFAGSSGLQLATEIRIARAHRMPFLLVHENDVARGGCEFGWILDSTPQDLVQDGLFREQLAVPLMRGDHREVSLALVERKLTPQSSRRLHHLTMVGNWSRLQLIRRMRFSLSRDIGTVAVGTVTRRGDSSQEER